LFRAAFLQNGAARNHDVAAAAIHLEDLEGLRHAHQGRHVAYRADVDLRAGQEGHGAVEIDRVAALDLVEDDAVDAVVGFERLFELDPALLAARLVAADDRLAKRVLDALDIDLDLVADLDRHVAAPGPTNSLSATRPSVLAPISMTATSFSIATTRPLTTEPSLISFLVNDSSSRAAKSSRLGARCCKAADIQSPQKPVRAAPAGLVLHPVPGRRRRSGGPQALQDRRAAFTKRAGA
jgi:hypothetical protein